MSTIDLAAEARKVELAAGPIHDHPWTLGESYLEICPLCRVKAAALAALRRVVEACAEIAQESSEIYMVGEYPAKHMRFRVANEIAAAIRALAAKEGA